MVEENEEPSIKTRRLEELKESSINFNHTTIQNESEEMAMQNIEQIMAQLSTDQRKTLESIGKSHESLINKLNATKN